MITIKSFLFCIIFVSWLITVCYNFVLAIRTKKCEKFRARNKNIISMVNGLGYKVILAYDLSCNTVARAVYDRIIIYNVAFLEKSSFDGVLSTTLHELYHHWFKHTYDKKFDLGYNKNEVSAELNAHLILRDIGINNIDPKVFNDNIEYINSFLTDVRREEPNYEINLSDEDIEFCRLMKIAIEHFVATSENGYIKYKDVV